MAGDVTPYVQISADARGGGLWGGGEVADKSHPFYLLLFFS